jgi:DNA-binding NtrC family response regulator
MADLIFVIEDEETTRMQYKLWLEGVGYETRMFPQAESCLAAMEAIEPAVVCLDLGLPGISGMEALERIRKERPLVSVIVITAEVHASIGVRAIKLGAFDYVLKPAEHEHFDRVVRQAVQHHKLLKEVESLRLQVNKGMPTTEFLGQSAAMNRISSQVGLILQNDVPVYIQGETGTGKELIARIIHNNGKRANGPFVPVNCGAIPRELQESQFFGHEKGSFTGAIKRHVGFFEEANGGTVFLDEVAALSADAQVKLLRVLQEMTIRRVGGSEEIPIDVRVISATHVDLRKMMDAGDYREDLFYRLVVYPISIPPLRDRQLDIPLFIGHYLGVYSKRMGVSVPKVSDAVLASLVSYNWPGNVRELENTVQFLLLAAQAGEIMPQHLPQNIALNQVVVTDEADRTESVRLFDALTGKPKRLDQIEMEVLLWAREQTDGNITQVAEILGVGRATVYRKLQEYEKAFGSDNKS